MFSHVGHPTTNVKDRFGRCEQGTDQVSRVCAPRSAARVRLELRSIDSPRCRPTTHLE